MNQPHLDEIITSARNRQVTLRGHFGAPVRIEGVDPIGDGFLQVRVRNAQGGLDETVLTTEELAEALRASSVAVNVASPSDVFLWVERERIRLAFAHDPYFAVLWQSSAV